MIEAIKKVLADYQSKQAQQRRVKNNRKNVQLILQGLCERGF